MKKSELTEIIREVIKETIRKVDSKYVVYPEKGGKRLGTHSTKKAAEKQLTAIHLNKENYADGKVDEAKQVGNLYHYTSAEGLKGILTSNSLNASEENYLGNELYYVSFTRNKNFHNKGQNFNVKTDYRITLDGDKLSSKYKIKPFAYIPGWDYTDNWSMIG